jgi:sugar phosphate isomerase/epimerase
MLAEITAMGFSAMDLWGAHLHWTWATPEHIATARDLLAKHRLQVVSYAPWITGEPAMLRAACVICRELGIPVIGGYVELAHTDRPAAAKILREHGIVYGYENHPEKSVAEILAKLGEGDEDVIGLTADTGWMGTGGIDVLPAMHRLMPRVKHVHLKDLKPRRAEKTGYQLIDMGHESCQLGDGTLPVEAVARMLTAVGYRGAVCIEHEPEDYDPRAECAESLVRVRRWLAG